MTTAERLLGAKQDIEAVYEVGKSQGGDTEAAFEVGKQAECDEIQAKLESESEGGVT